MIDPVPRRDPFGLAYRTLKARVTEGSLRPGEQVKIAEFAVDLRLSTTPVREALYRLVGEDLIEDRRRLGYFVPRLRGRTLAELYGLRRLYLTAAFDAVSPAAPDPADDAPSLFAEIMRGAGDRILSEAFARVDARLSPYRPAETRLVDVDADAALLASASDPAALRAAIAAHHEHRQRLADAIADEAEAGEPAI